MLLSLEVKNQQTFGVKFKIYSLRPGRDRKEIDRHFNAWHRKLTNVTRGCLKSLYETDFDILSMTEILSQAKSQEKRIFSCTDYRRNNTVLPHHPTPIPFWSRVSVQLRCPYRDRGNQEMISMVLYPEPVFRQTHQSHWHVKWFHLPCWVWSRQYQWDSAG